MIASLLRLISTVATVFVVVGFVLFALEEADNGSRAQQARVDGISQPSPEPATEAQREQEHGKVREFIDDVNDVLLEPFDGIVDSDEIWVTRGVPALLAFLFYGLLLRLFASYATRLP